MTDPSTQKVVEQAMDQAVGQNPSELELSTGTSLFSWVTRTGPLLPPWWSKARDLRMSQIWKECNHLAIAVYNAQAKIVGIPFKIIPVDASVPEHMDQAEMLTNLLLNTADFGRTWPVAYAKFVEDLLTTDNGAFMEVIGRGRPDGPLVGMPISVRHLDSCRCTRTANPEFPVLYTDTKGQIFKIHYTRIIYTSQMPSSRAEMNGVGFCAVGRCVEIAQTLTDMIRYKQERLGSRPQNQILVGKGITGKQIREGFRQVDSRLDAQGFTRYAQTVAFGSQDTDIGIDKIDMVHMDPFDEADATNLGMFAIAAAIGMDADELWPTSGKSGGKADANLRRMRSRGRLPQQITQEIAIQFTQKYLPPHLIMIFDFQDDEQDQQRAIIGDIRGRNRERDLGTGSINIRAAREEMLKVGEISRDEFDSLELTDGRLPDGRTISVLFFTDDPVFQRLLHFIEDPIVTADKNDKQLLSMVTEVQKQRQLVLFEMARTRSRRLLRKITQAFFALNWLEEQYMFAAGLLLPPVPMQQRRLRIDTRVAPEETSPQPGELSPAQQAQVSGNENITQVGAV